MQRGALIVLEGCDCSGKTSQTKNIVNSLNIQNVPAERMCFPDRTTVTGGLIDSYLKGETNLPDQAIHLLFSANRWEAVPRMEELLRSGTTLVIDRYSYSGVAYSFAKKGSLNIEWYKNPEAGLPKPDLVLYLDLDIEVLKKRKGFGEERYEKSEFQESVDKVYQGLKSSNWKVINADKSESDLTSILVTEILQVVDRVKTLPISKLWLWLMIEYSAKIGELLGTWVLYYY